MIKLINEDNNSKNLRQLVIDELKSESDCLDNDLLDFSYTEPDLPNVIFCTEKRFNITFSLDCENPSKSIISHDNDLIPSDYTDPDNFFKRVSELDKISDTFRHLWYDFTSAVSNVKGGFK